MPVTIKPLPVDKIRIDGDTQARVAISDEVVAEYAEALQADSARANWPPVITYFDSTDYWLADGFHRVLAARKAGLPTLLAEVNSGTREDARWAAIGANKTHGLRRTNADKRRATELALRMHPELSDRALAEHVGVSNTFVGQVRSQLSTVDSCGPRVGADGRTRRLPPPPPRRNPPPPPPRTSTPAPPISFPPPPPPPAAAQGAFDAYGTPIQIGDVLRYVEPADQTTPPSHGQLRGKVDAIEPDNCLTLTVWNPQIGTMHDCGRRVHAPGQLTCKDTVQSSRMPPEAAPRAAGEPRDDVGRPIPPEAMPTWERRQEAQDLLTSVSRIRSAVRKAQDAKDQFFAEINFSAVMAHLDQAYAGLEVVKPYAVCPSCQGLIGCRLCVNRRMISKFRWDTLCTAEQKRAALAVAGRS